ncbi:MAG: hypothetical protein H0U74_13450 [Bradymonadaceae bacterium]|nr:hypothetical protein [Lujinxingiaceae bacterium]
MQPRAGQETRIDQSQLDQLFARLPNLVAEADDAVDLSMRAGTMAAPRTGEVIATSFPPPVDRGAIDDVPRGALEVLRFQPDGEVERPPRLSVTFSQPMVAVTSHADTIKGAVPVTLTPAPPGQWRWIGTKTLIFEPTEPFAMATDYQVAVEKGTPSALGFALEKGFNGGFSTPPLELVRVFPEDGPQRLQPVIFLSFNQRIDAKAMLEHIEISTRSGRSSFRIATPDEIQADEVVRVMADPLKADTWLAIRADKAFSLATEVNVTLKRGAPSAEGPKRSVESQTRTLETHGAFRLVQSGCAWSDECRPDSAWSLEFSNPPAAGIELSDFIRVEPAVEELVVQPSGKNVYLSGRFQGRTTYKVSIDAALNDVFGQKLGVKREVQLKVDAAFQSLGIGNHPMVVLDPSGKREFAVYSVNHKRFRARLHRVGPQDWQRYSQGIRDSNVAMPGTLVSDMVIELNGDPDRQTKTAISLAPALGVDGLGHVVLEIEPSPAPLYVHGRPARVWLQSTRMGLDATVDPSALRVWASSLDDGKALEGVQISFEGGGVQATTGADGMAQLLMDQKRREGSFWVARLGSDSAILLEKANSYYDNTRWSVPLSTDAVRWLVIDDRQMYKPGEEARIKGWARLIEGGTAGGIGIAGAGKRLDYEVFESRGNSIAKGTLAMSATGGFDLRFGVPEGTNLGRAEVRFSIEGIDTPEGAQHTHVIQIQEFRRPEFEVTAGAAAGPHFAGGEAEVWVKASYFAGGALTDTMTQWSVTQRAGSFTPPNRSEFSFGTWQPWWQAHKASGATIPPTRPIGKTDMAGEHRLVLPLATFSPPRASTVSAIVSVTDVNRQTWQASTNLLVHPAAEYVGLRSARLFVERGDPLEIDAIVTDLEGVAVAGRAITMLAHRLRWTFTRGQWTEEAADEQKCALASQSEAVRCTFKTDQGGQYRIVASIEDAKGRANQSQLTRWVSGGQPKPTRQIEEEVVVLIPDKQEYAVGDVAEILIQAPFAGAEGLVTLSRQGVVSQERISLTGTSHTLRIPMAEAYLPNLHVKVELNGASGRLNASGELDSKLPKRPAFASGQLNLAMSKSTRTLSVRVTPAKAGAEPGSTAEVEIVVLDTAGRAVANSDVLLFAVDEAVLALSSYQLADPISIFYAHRASITSAHRSRKAILLVDPNAIPDEAEQGISSASGSLGEVFRTERARRPSSVSRTAASRESDSKPRDTTGVAQAPIALRENFDALAAFEPTLVTGADGRARASFKLPDNLTRYRLMSVAVSGPHHFGTGESQITARLPLMVRPSAPRFLNFGDTFELPVVLQNQTDEAMEVFVGARATNVTFAEVPGYSVSIAANDRVEVRFAATTVKAGRARFQVGASTKTGAGDWADAAYFDLPVWTPATTEAFATYGTIDSGSVFQPVKLPDDVFVEFGGLELTTSSTELQALTDAFIYLSNYPYECAEQISSRILAVAALRDVLSAFQAEGMPSTEAIEAAMTRDIERLDQLQNPDGGFGFWRRGEASWPYTSLHVAHALRRAQQKGYTVPAHLISRTESYLQSIENRVPAFYGVHAKYALMAYALYVRNVGEQRDVASARALFTRAGVGGLSLEALGWLLSVFAQDASASRERDAILKHLNNRVQESAATAQFASDYGDSNYLMLSSSRRTDGVLLEALIAAEPTSDLIPKLVRGLMGHRKKGQWGSTQDNVFVLLALDRYFNVFEKETPNFVGRAWLGDQFVGEHTFKGRTTERHHVDVPMAYLAKSSEAQTFAIQKDGTGRMYYRLGMRYAPKSLMLEPVDHGFAVERAYEPVDDDNDVKRRADGGWEIRAGARVKVVLTMSASARRFHVALVDPLPAGLEALNPALATTTLPADANMSSSTNIGTGRRSFRSWWGPWYEHQNMRDERVEAFSSLLWEGVHTYSYFARATTPGEFNVPPARAEEMYHPETFGRSGTDRVVVK